MGHEVRTVGEMGWDGRRNGELLSLAAAEFGAFVTVDRNLSFQQNVSAHAIAVFVMRAKTNRLTDLIPLAPLVLAKLATVSPGMVAFVGDA
jgi:hypothetical protein